MLELKDLLKELRPKHGTQVEVAKKLGMKSQQISQYESGIRNPKLPFYRKWKVAFNEDLQVMLDEANDSPETKKRTSVPKGSDIEEKPLRVEGDLVIPQEIFHKEYVILPKAMYQYLHARLLGLQKEEVVKKAKKKV